MAYTSVLAGSTNYPDIRLRWAPTTQPTAATQSLVDITDRLRGWAWGYGRNDELSEFQPGNGYILLDNRDRAFDPSFGAAFALTASGNEITDASRALRVQGDGLQGDSSYGIWDAATNLVTNGGFETNTTGWFPQAPNTIARSLVQARFGSYSGLATRDTGTADTNCGALNPFTLTAATYSVSAWLWVPTAYDGSAVTFDGEAFTSATGTLTVNADLALRDQWQHVSFTLTPNAGDLVGAIVLRLIGATTGKFVYIDGVQVEQNTVATPYVHTDGGAATRAAALVTCPTSGYINKTQGWCAVRFRAGWSNASEPAGNPPGLMSWFIDANNYFGVTYAETTNQFWTFRVSAGVSYELVVTEAISVGELVTVVAAWDASNIKLSVNGAAFTSSAATVPVGTLPATFWIGSFLAGNQCNGDILWFAAGTGTLTDADAGKLYRNGDRDLTAAVLPAAAETTMVWGANDQYASTGSPYAGNVKPRRMFEMKYRYNSVEYDGFVGYARGFPQEWPASGADGLVRVELVDALAVIQGIDLVVGFSRGVEDVGTRIGAVLDAVAFPAGARSIDAGTTSTAAIDVTSVGVSGLAHCRTVSADENGQLFVAKNGNVTFHNRQQRFNQSSTHTFSDVTGGTLKYDTTFAPDFDDTYLWNSVYVQGPDSGDTAGTATGGTTSMSDYFTLVKTYSSQLVYEPDRTALAQYQVLLYQQPQLRSPAVQFKGASRPTALWPTLLALEVSDRVTIQRFATGGTPMTMVQNVEGIAHTCVPGGPWITQVATSPADTNSYWTLESTSFGSIDSTFLLAP